MNAQSLMGCARKILAWLLAHAQLVETMVEMEWHLVYGLDKYFKAIYNH